MKFILTQLKTKDIKPTREKLLAKQNGICPLTGIEIEKGQAVLDHQHRFNKKEKIGENGGGLIRGVLDFRANQFEGKVFNWYRRLGLRNMVPLPFLLRNLADYLERKNLPLIHPTETSYQKIKKVCYNKLVKAVNESQKVPSYPKSKKLTKKLKELFNKYGVKIEYYK